MSDKLEGFRGRSIENVQAIYFLDRLPARGGRFPYRSAGLNAAAGTVVLFQFQARIIATAVFIRDEKSARPRASRGGTLHFEADSFQIFDPVGSAVRESALRSELRVEAKRWRNGFDISGRTCDCLAPPATL